MNQSWSIIIFCYNEEKTIGIVIDSVNNFLNYNKLTNSEIIIIDDGSTDGSEKIIRTYLKNYERITYIRFPKNQGIGNALLAGYKNSKKENVVAVPGDGQFDINELKSFINFPEKSFISFYRQDLRNYSIYRKVISKLNKVFNKYMLNLDINDVNWVKAYKTKDLKEIDLRLDSSLIGSEICAKLIMKKHSIIESESVYHNRVGGKSKGASLKTISQATKELIKLVFIVRKFNKVQN